MEVLLEIHVSVIGSFSNSDTMDNKNKVIYRYSY